jgi:predicted sulfurtransferase/predicted O-methyltransferase YrrM
MAVPTTSLDAFHSSCNAIPELTFMENGLNIDPIPIPSSEYAANPSFSNLHVRAKSQIVADGLSSPLDWQSAGYDMPPTEWHETLLSSSSKQEDKPILLDCRNKYETGVGSFVTAQPLNTESFRESWDVLEDKLKDVPRDKPIMAYCTGGIRCVKVGAYLSQKMGFQNVSRLAGGIIAYDREIANTTASLFHGTNYVFDNRQGRVITDHKLGDCITCGEKTNLLSNCYNDACHKRIVQCLSCRAPGAFVGCCSVGCRTTVLREEKRDFYVRKKESTHHQEFDPAVFNDVQRYALENTTPAPAVFDEIMANTLKHLPSGAHMVSSGIQGRLLSTLASMTNNGRVLEIGTFTGMALCFFVEGVSSSNTNGFVLSLERDERAIEIAAHHLQLFAGAAKVGDAIARGAPMAKGDAVKVSIKGVDVELAKVDDALSHLVELKDSQTLPFDLVFVDADKSRLYDYVDYILENGLLAERGVLLVDNVIWKGVGLAGDDGDEENPNLPASNDASKQEIKRGRRQRKLAKIMHEFNERILADDRVDVVMLPLRDGLSIIRRRSKAR